MLLTDEFLSKYPDFPPHQTEISAFVYLRTYARYLPKLKRRETWKEVAARSTNYNTELHLKHMEKIGYPVTQSTINVLRKENEELFNDNFNLNQFLSGRTTFVGGSETSVAELYPLSNFNCSFTNIDSLYDLCDLFYNLLIGVGVGFKCTPQMAKKLEPVRLDLVVDHIPYQSVYPTIKMADTYLDVQGENATIYVGDSKEGWVWALKYWIDIHTSSDYIGVKCLTMNYNYVRKNGEVLKRFGGTASGAEPMIELFAGLDAMFKDREDEHIKPIEVVDWLAGNDEDGEEVTLYKYGQLRPIHILSWGNRIGYGVVVGGVRRTAEIFGIGDDPEIDWETVFAKYGLNGFWKEDHFLQHEKIGRMLDELGIEKPAFWDTVGTRNYDSNVNGDLPYNFGRPLHHRRMSNNSIAFTKQPKREILDLIFEMMQLEGEPGFVNLRELAKRRYLSMGYAADQITEEMLQEMMPFLFTNPCGEIDLWNKGVCNLTTINVAGYVEQGEDGQYYLNRFALYESQRRSVRAGIRMTLVELEQMPWSKDPNAWNRVQKRDTLIGCSLTGWQDAMDILGYSETRRNELLQRLRQVAKEEGAAYSKMLRIPEPLLDTTIKPEGTLSLVAVNRVTQSPVSSGLHKSHAPYYIRRVRINAADPLAKAVIELGWAVHPEVGTPDNKIENARTLVIEFPVASGAKRSKEDTTVEEQFSTYFNFQQHYTNHNSSNTIDIKSTEEWHKAAQTVWDNFDNFVGVSFLATDGGTYALTPLEACTEEEFNRRKAEMKPFDMNVLMKHEVGYEMEDELLDDPNCSNGVCGVR
jgi:ribonucleoside-triphosphate reductase